MIFRGVIRDFVSARMESNPTDMPAQRRRIAVIGSGVSGLGAAWLLSRACDVVLFEAADRLGGHAWTVTVSTRGREVPVDIGFIVFNRVNYPNLCRLFGTLDVPVRRSDMSFAVSVNDGALEYGCRSLRAALAQPANAAKPGFWRMIRDIAVFNRTALADSSADPRMTLEGLIRRRRLGKWFERYYLLPMSGAIWSTPRTQMLKFPAGVLARFFSNHGLLSFTGQHQWWTVEGGSRNYVSKIADSMSAQVRRRTPVKAVIRGPEGIRVKAAGQNVEGFDGVVFACHSDTALELLKDAGPDERRILGAISYRRNRIVLHTDSRLMPRRRACWSSWVYLANSPAEEEQASVTYWMNSLQGIPDDTPLFTTLNPPSPVDDRCVLAEHPFEHPQYDFSAVAAQAELPSIQGRGGAWYCGAWTGMGFHEDGLASAVRVAGCLGVSPPWK